MHTYDFFPGSPTQGHHSIQAHLRLTGQFLISLKGHRMLCAQRLHPQKLRGHVQCLQESLKLGRLSPETLTSAWHRPGEELGASGTGDPSTHASKPCVWNRLGGGSEASRAAEAAAGWSMSRVWHRLGEGSELSRTREATAGRTFGCRSSVSSIMHHLTVNCRDCSRKPANQCLGPIVTNILPT